MDYSKYKSSGRYYTGAERKKRDFDSGRALYCEICKEFTTGINLQLFIRIYRSHLFRIAGIEAQETFLGKCDGLPVVVMKDFIGGDEIFVPFNDVGDSTLEQSRERYKYTYEDIMLMLEENMKLTNVEETVRSFWICI